MDESDETLLDGIQFVFDPVSKTAIVIREDVKIAVPGRFPSYHEAHKACMQVVWARYQNAYVRE